VLYLTVYRDEGDSAPLLFPMRGEGNMEKGEEGEEAR